MRGTTILLIYAVDYVTVEEDTLCLHLSLIIH